MVDKLITVRKGETLDLRGDLFGARPVYVIESLDEVLVATSQQELRRAGAVCGVEPQRLRAHLLGDSIEPLSGGVQRLQPGSRLTVEGGQARMRAAEPLEVEDLSERKSRDRLATELQDRLGDAVDRMLGDHRPAISLGIGIDSASLLALVEDRGPATWTLVSGPLDPDLLNTVRLAKHFGAQHNMFEARERTLPEKFEAAVLASETVLWNPRAVAFYRLFCAMAEKHDVVMSGVGADELLMGHPSMIQGHEGAPPIARRFEDDRRLIRRLLADDFQVPEPADRPAMAVDEARQLMVRTTLRHDVLPMGARGSLAPDLEVVFPYLDSQVAAFALGLGEADLVGERGLGKSLLREGWKGIIPDAIRLRPHRVRLSPPGGGEAAVHKLWAELYESILSEDCLKDLQIVDRLKVRRLIGAYSSQTEYQHPGFGVMDRVLMRLSSLAVLQKALS